ncbi:MAG: SMP-30/gluconolactonase/LRE family protein [Rhodospirillaceae bacterium]|nr:SMP-30/gluconolactonase/LRE family protein [Rhodospirillaceae bacterium]
MGYRIECVLQCGNHLGEGPVWDVDTGVLWWLDGTGRRVGNPSIWRLDPRTDAVASWSLDHDVGALAVRRNGKLVLALDDGFYLFDPATGTLQLITLIEADEPRSRLNDGKVDRRGRFVAGGMDDKEELAICGLWRLDPDFTVTRIEAGIICTNGPCWSPDDGTFYVADTFVDEFWAYDYDIETGAVSNRRVFATTREVPGVPDGSTVDAEGCLWNAELISGDLVRYDPNGNVERRIGFPVANITSVMFGGENLDEIYVTSMARVKHPAVHDRFRVDTRPQFGAGSLFRLTGLGIRGVPEPRFAG